MTLDRGPALAALEILVGQWSTEGEIHGAPEEQSRLVARDTYEWLPGGFFLEHTVSGVMGGEEVRSKEIIGYDAARGTYVTWSFDDRGNTAEYEATLRDREWRIVGDTERFSGAFSTDGQTLEGTWERSENGADWMKWMTVRLSKSR